VLKVRRWRDAHKTPPRALRLASSEPTSVRVSASAISGSQLIDRRNITPHKGVIIKFLADQNDGELQYIRHWTIARKPEMHISNPSGHLHIDIAGDLW
jgi:hypothetical protein